MPCQPFMPRAHQSEPWAWTLDRSRPRTLAAAGVRRWLRVEDGCVWLTARDGDEHAPDLWLGRGDSVELPPGSAWVVQGWPQARVSLLHGPGVLSPVSAWRAALVSGLRSLAPRLHAA